MIILYSGNKEIKLDVKDESYSYEAIIITGICNGDVLGGRYT